MFIVLTNFYTFQAKKLYEQYVYTIMYRIGRKDDGSDALTDEKIYTYGQKVSFVIIQHIHLFQTI